MSNWFSDTWDSMVGDNSGKAKDAFNNNMNNANDYAKNMSDWANANNKSNQDYAKQMQDLAKQNQINGDQAIADSNTSMNASKNQGLDNLADMGISANNKAYATTSASYDGAKASAVANIQNQVNQQNFNNQMNAINGAGNFTNTGYNNLINGNTAGFNAQTGANNAMAAYYANKAQQGNQMWGGIANMAGSAAMMMI